MSLSPSYLYLDDEGYTRWQGETSGMPLLDLLVERHRHKVITKQEPDQPLAQNGWAVVGMPTAQAAQAAMDDWFPDRPTRRTESNPEVVWKLITSFIAPDLMDRYVILTGVWAWGFWGLELVTMRYGTDWFWRSFASSLVQCYLSTSYYLMPFLHVPTFLAVSLLFLVL